ncbi:uncharacterized protein TNCV_3412331 [Trichonephila clavipes]|uniref:Mutator-like transposase domain-containing protein n=1 Tax=Trichonephila clavipes TaxID=2585209 RepID=A0A8X6RP26_TRICX|nr:uncharacterized protein TNCV_3412331 [Trichonephila clavipes]
MKEVAEESMKMAAVEEYSSSPDNPFNGDGDTKTINALSENKPYGDDYLIQKIECVGHVQKENGTRLMKLKLVYSKKELSDGKTIGGKGRLTDSLIDKLAHYYALMMNRYTGFVLQIQIHGVSIMPQLIIIYKNYKHKPSVAKAVQDVIKPVFADLSHPALLKKCLGARAQWKTECRSVVFSDESRFCLGTSDGRMSVSRKPGERFQPNCSWPRA